MEQVLQSGKISEIEEDAGAGYDLSGNVLLFPVRHHSPVCAFHLKKAIADFSPDLILIEGPDNASGLIPTLTNPDSEAPMAFYYAYRDSKGYVGEKNKTYRCYYPFLDCSPELVALREAERLEIPAAFMDLSYGEILIGTAEGRGIRRDSEKQTYNDDYLLSRSRYFELLCEKTGVRDFEEFWEKYFEQRGLTESTEQFVSQMLIYCGLSRAHTPKEEMEADGCLLREQHMAFRIQKALADGKRVLAVTGGFHTPGLRELLKTEVAQDKPHSMEKDDQGVYPMAYSMEAADALNGYASGMQSPDFYDKVWKRLEETESGAYEETVLSYLIAVGKKARKQEETVSTYDEICAVSMAKGLAALRGKAEPGLYELRDSVLSSYIKGEVNLSTEAPLRILRELTTGERIGKLCKDAPRPHLLTDFEETCLAFGLKLHSALEQEITLEIFTKEKHMRLSRFFYQLDFLNIGFAGRKKGADLVNRRDRSRIREIWRYKWNSQVTGNLIDVSIRGGTVAEAARALLCERFANGRNCEEAAKLLVQSFQMGLWEEQRRLQGQFRSILVCDGDFFSLSRGFSHLIMLSELRTLYQISGDGQLEQLIAGCFQKLLQMLPAMAGIADEQMGECMECCLSLYQATGRKAFSGLRTSLMEAFERLLAQKKVQPGLEGAVLGLLYGQNSDYEERIALTASGYIHGTKEMLPKSAAFLRGLFFTARDYVFVSSAFLQLIDELLDRLSDEAFLKLLPELRMAFGCFTPMETNRIAGQAAALHGKGGKELLGGKEVLPAVYAYGERLDRLAGERRKKEDAKRG